MLTKRKSLCQNSIAIATVSIVFFVLSSMNAHAQEIQTFKEPEQDSQTNVICQIVGVKAEYPGGMKTFNEEFIPLFRTPKEFTEDRIRVIVSFTVEKDGSIVDGKIIRDPGFDVGQQVLDILPTMKKWKPAMKSGEVEASQFTLPITIQVNPEKK